MKILILFLTIFLASMVSANGLVIIGDNSFDIIKEEGIDTEFQVTIQNQDSFSFYNIELEGEGVAEMQEINRLDSGDSVNVTINLEEDEEFNGDIIIKGEYEASLGASNITEIIEVDYDNGISKCNLELIEGDTVIWQNIGLDEIRLKDSDSGEYFATIQDEENYSKIFSEPITLEYVAVWIIPFTEICTIEVSDDEGLRHSSEYDAEINLNLTIDYQETEIETTFLTTSYSLDYNQIKTGEYFSIKNIGSEIARDIKISSDWISFPDNEDEFDLGAGESINIEYKITPTLSTTNETDKTYIKTIKIEGNFQTIENNISVYIEYANLDNIVGSGDVDYEWWKNAFNLLCLDYEDKDDDDLREICDRGEDYYYNGSRGSGLEFTEESSVLFLEKYGEDLIEENKERKSNEEFKTNISNTLEEINSRLGIVENETSSANESSINASNTSIFLIILIASGIILTVLVILIIKQRKKIDMETKLGISGGEYGRE